MSSGARKLVVIDTNSARSVRSIETNGHGAHDLSFAGDVAVASLGEHGAMLVPLR